MTDDFSLAGKVALVAGATRGADVAPAAPADGSTRASGEDFSPEKRTPATVGHSR